jgi:hypothetical protein
MGQLHNSLIFDSNLVINPVYSQTAFTWRHLINETDYPGQDFSLWRAGTTQTDVAVAKFGINVTAVR